MVPLTTAIDAYSPCGRASTATAEERVFSNFPQGDTWALMLAGEPFPAPMRPLAAKSDVVKPAPGMNQS